MTKSKDNGLKQEKGITEFKPIDKSKIKIESKNNLSESPSKTIKKTSPSKTENQTTKQTKKRIDNSQKNKTIKNIVEEKNVSNEKTKQAEKKEPIKKLTKEKNEVIDKIIKDSSTPKENKNTKKIESKQIISKSNNNKSKNKIKTKKRKRRKLKKTVKIILIITVILIIVITVIISTNLYNKHKQEKQLEEYNNNLYQEIIKHYNEYVITNKETDIYTIDNNNYIKVGKIGINQELSLDNQEITHETKYFKINSFQEEYYIYYKDIDTIEELTPINDRYKRYIVFNKNIITKDTTNFYDEEGNLIYRFDKSFDLPIIINKKNIYGVEFNNRLLYVKSEDVIETQNNKNTEEKHSSKVMTLAYHRIYDPKTEECDQVICHTEKQFNSHMEYLSEKNYLTLTTKELSDFIDGYIQIPKKSVVITIDDGTMVTRGIKILEKYKLNASLFIVTIRFKESDYTTKFKSDYVELHSHSHNMHWAGECAGYGTQGGGILCLPKERVLEDLKTSSEILGGSKIFCYPFYDYSTRAINLLKEAGYTMAFAGLLNTNGYTYVGTNKMLVPRATILSYTTFNEFKAYVTY